MILSPDWKPAFAAGDPATTALMVASEMGASEMPTPVGPSPAGGFTRGTTDVSTSVPSRSTTTLIGFPLNSRARCPTSDDDSTGTPATSTTRSPACHPATSAGDPGTTDPI